MKKVHWFFVTCGYFNKAYGDVFTLKAEEVTCSHCKSVVEKAAKQSAESDTSPLCPECEVELHLTTAGEHVCRNEACGLYLTQTAGNK